MDLDKVAEDLTPRELEMLKLVAEGLSNSDIAKALCISLGRGDYGPNKYLHVEIRMTGTSNMFSIYLDSPNVYFPTYYSTNNTMGKGYYIDIGAEVSGTHGASAPDLYIYDNRWIDSFGSAILQWEDGSYSSNPGPIHREWAFRPSQWRGGNFHVQCEC